MNTVNRHGFWYDNVNLFPIHTGGGGEASDEDVEKCSVIVIVGGDYACKYM